MKQPHPGTVSSDAQAFDQIARRFRGEVGRILASVDFENGSVPFWALLRMMFPVAESLGDLIYRKNHATAYNLRSVLENEFEQVRTGYAGKAAVLALLYRNSLVHQDELRVVISAGKEVAWCVSSGDDSNHLRLQAVRPGCFVIELQPRAFYADILEVCARAAKRRWGGSVMSRYNGWMDLDLDITKSNGTVRAAKAEIASF